MQVTFLPPRVSKTTGLQAESLNSTVCWARTQRQMNFSFPTSLLPDTRLSDKRTLRRDSLAYGYLFINL